MPLEKNASVKCLNALDKEACSSLDAGTRNHLDQDTRISITQTPNSADHASLMTSTLFKETSSAAPQLTPLTGGPLMSSRISSLRHTQGMSKILRSNLRFLE